MWLAGGLARRLCDGILVMQRLDGQLAPVQFAAFAEQHWCHGQDAEESATREEGQQQQRQRRMPFAAQEKIQADLVRVFQREAEKQDEQDCRK